MQNNKMAVYIYKYIITLPKLTVQARKMLGLEDETFLLKWFLFRWHLNLFRGYTCVYLRWLEHTWYMARWLPLRSRHCWRAAKPICLDHQKGHSPKASIAILNKRKCNVFLYTLSSGIHRMVRTIWSYLGKEIYTPKLKIMVYKISTVICAYHNFESCFRHHWEIWGHGIIRPSIIFVYFEHHGAHISAHEMRKCNICNISKYVNIFKEKYYIIYIV